MSYKQGEFVAYKTLLEFKKMAKEKAVSKNTVVFNNLVINKYEYENAGRFQLPRAGIIDSLAN